MLTLPGDGFVGAFWKITRNRPSAVLTVTPLRRLSARHRSSVGAEARRLLAVAAAGVPSTDVVIEAD